jgi:hexokinase
MENFFELTNIELGNIANELQKRIAEGLIADKQEILAIPTYIQPPTDIQDEKVLALDWGGTNFRAAIVEFKAGKATVVEVVKDKLSNVEVKNFSGQMLQEKMGEYIARLKKLDDSVTKIGYCFSYPAESCLDGDAILLRWTKGINIPDMIGARVGELLVNHLNTRNDINTRFKSIKVINDTVACLFAGLTERTEQNKAFDSYIGLIVGTGTNMASLMPLHKIEKLNRKDSGDIPVNLESGNFNPPHLTVVDGLVDAMSNNKGSQRFEKAISGGYLGELFKTTFPFEKIKSNFDGADLSDIINNPSKYKEEYVNFANHIYNRSAKLVAASLAGLIQLLVKQNSEIKNVCLAADGSLFWSNDRRYINQVDAELKRMLPNVAVKIADEKKEAIFIGSAVSALS